MPSSRLHFVNTAAFVLLLQSFVLSSAVAVEGCDDEDVHAKIIYTIYDNEMHQWRSLCSIPGGEQPFFNPLTEYDTIVKMAVVVDPGYQITLYEKGDYTGDAIGPFCGDTDIGIVTFRSYRVEELVGDSPEHCQVQGQ